MNYYVERIGQVVLVFCITVTISFAMYRFLPGGPVEIIIDQLSRQMSETGEVDPEQFERVAKLVETYTNIRPDKPWYLAYIDYWREIIFHQDFGTSIRKRQPVTALIMSRLPWSIFISVYGLALGVSTSLLFGAVMAHNEGGFFDQAMTVITISTNTVPYYIVAILSLIVFAFELGWFPSGGKITPGTTPGFNYPYVAGLVEHAALPILSSFIAGFGGALAYRGNCIREMGKGYLRVAELRGISEARMAIRYVGRNALLPIYTGLMLGLAALFGSSIILEVIFQYQAMGLLTFEALQNRDYPLLMGTFIFYTVITLLGILIADLTYGIIDPRVKSGDEREVY